MAHDALLKRFNTVKRKRLSRLPGDYCDRHHNEPRVRGGSSRRKNLVLLWRKLHHDPFTRYCGLLTFYQVAGAFETGVKFRFWLLAPLSDARLATMMGKMRTSPLVRRIVNYEDDEEGQFLLRLLFGPRNFDLDDGPDFNRMAAVMRRFHRKHQEWAFWNEFNQEIEVALQHRAAKARAETRLKAAQECAA